MIWGYRRVRRLSRRGNLFNALRIAQLRRVAFGILFFDLRLRVVIQHQQTDATVDRLIAAAIFQLHGVGHAHHAQHFAAIEPPGHQLTT